MKPIPDRIFIDSNIIIYLYSQDEPLKKHAVERLFTNFDQLIISTQVLNECIHVMHRKKKVKLEIVAQVVKELLENFFVTTITSSTIQKALFIAGKYCYSYYDSLIISSSLENQCEVLFTEDMHHFHEIENTLKIINPFTS